MGQADGFLFWHRQPLAKGLCPVAFYREREVVLGSEIPGIADVASDAPCCQSFADSRDEQPVLLFQVISPSLMFTSNLSASGNTATVAAEVCIRPCVSVAGTR